jgi:hypothetical protein
MNLSDIYLFFRNLFIFLYINIFLLLFKFFIFFLTLVITPIVLFPSGSIFLANYNPSEVVISAFAGATQSIIVLSSLAYLKLNFLKNI